jgi:hypothetical protein
VVGVRRFACTVRMSIISGRAVPDLCLLVKGDIIASLPDITLFEILMACAQENQLRRRLHTAHLGKAALIDYMTRLYELKIRTCLPYVLDMHMQRAASEADSDHACGYGTVFAS